MLGESQTNSLTIQNDKMSQAEQEDAVTNAIAKVIGDDKNALEAVQNMDQATIQALQEAV